MPLHEEEDGKLFPDSNRARDVLTALLAEAQRAGVELRPGCRVMSAVRGSEGFSLSTNRGALHAPALVLATGGQSLPRSGSDGAGYAIAAALGHTIVPTTPALVPLVLDGSMHRALSGVAQDVEIAIWVEDRVAVRIRGSMLWTHFGVSGPAALNASRHWLRARLEGRAVRLTVSVRPGSTFGAIDSEWTARAREHPRATMSGLLARDVPASFARALLSEIGLPHDLAAAGLTRDDRRTLVRALLEYPLPVIDSRGYTYAEATAGGVTLTEVDPASMASRVCEGLSVVGEMLDVDGRIGGFNFQWAWSTGYVAGRALAV